MNHFNNLFGGRITEPDLHEFHHQDTLDLKVEPDTNVLIRSEYVPIPRDLRSDTFDYENSKRLRMNLDPIDSPYIKPSIEATSMAIEKLVNDAREKEDKELEDSKDE